MKNKKNIDKSVYSLLAICLAFCFILFGKAFGVPVDEVLNELPNITDSVTDEETVTDTETETDGTEEPDNTVQETPNENPNENTNNNTNEENTNNTVEQPETPDNSEEPTEPTEPSEPVEPIEPEETVSNPLSFTEGEHAVENLRIEATAENADAIYANGEGTIVTIESGYFDGGDNGSTTAVYARDGAKVVINGGIFKAGEGCAVIYAKNNATVEINGGFYEAYGAYNGTYFVLNLSDGTNSTIVVKGGTFVNFNPAENASENPAVNFVAEGYEVVSETKENGDIWYTVQPISKNQE